MLSASLWCAGRAGNLQTLVIDLKLQRYLEISESADKATLERLLAAFAANLDFGIVTAAVAVDRPGQGPGGAYESIANTAMAYAEAAKHVQYAGRDPVLERLKRLSVPFCYDQSVYVSEDAVDLWDFQAPFGLRNGIAVAMHLPGGKHFLLGFDRHHALPADGPRLVRMLGSLALLASFTQSAAFRISTTIGQKQTQASVRLTARELEVLQWTLEGKTAWEIAQILTISYDTVLSHLRGCMRKFGVSSKHQAALRAVEAGLLRF